MSAGALPVGERLTAIELLDRLVAFDTESARSNLALVAFVEAYLAGWGVASLRVPNGAGTKAALFATIGPAERGGVLLSAHTDVVPVEGQSWSSDPFTLRVADGRAYGRGAVDMKGFCALVLALVPEMLAAPLQVPIHLLLSYDEETTCLGSLDVIRRLGHDLPRPLAVIVGEPTGLEVADAHKNVATFHTQVHGHEAHSAKPQLGASAVEAAAELVCALNRLGDELRERGDPSGRFDPPHSTVHVGMIRGGTARNILAKHCALHWEVRGVPGLDLDEVPRRLAEVAEAVTARRLGGGRFGRVETEREVVVPGLAPEPGSAAEGLALALARRNRTVTVPYVTEAGHFQAAGLPTIVCGPGSIDQAHQPDEFISLDDLAAGEGFLKRLVAWCSTASGGWR